MLKTLILIIFLGLLVLISRSDCRRRLIPDSLVGALFFVGIIAQLFLHEPGMVSGIAGVAAGGLPLLLVSLVRRGAFGGGDIKLMAAAGMFLGAELVLIALVLGFLTGGLYGLVCVLLKKKGRKDKFAFGPFLCIGIAGAYLGQGILW